MATGKPGRELIEQALASGAPALDEDAGKQFFAAYGIAVPQGGTVTSADEAVRLAGRIGYPVVMKGSAPPSSTRPTWGWCFCASATRPKSARPTGHWNPGRRRRGLRWMGSSWSTWSSASGSSWSV